MLFGHQTDDTGQPVATTLGGQATGVNPLAVDPATGASLPTAPPQPMDLSEQSVLNQPTDLGAADPMTSVPAADPALPLPPAPDTGQAVPAPVTVDPEPAASSSPFTDDSASDTSSAPGSASATLDATASPANDSLLTLKQQALGQLSPLVDQLDQSPEEKFRTIMMLIQTTDDPSRLQAAYDAAQAITDEKARAQALLDVVNEINYFTHKDGQ